MRLLNIIIIFLCIACVSACNDSNEMIIDKQGSPALWKISAKSGAITSDTQSDISQSHIAKPLYIFGTIHLLPKGAKWQSETLNKAIADSDVLITETIGLEDDANVSRIFNHMSRDEAVIDIEQRVQDDQRSKLNQIINNQNLSQKLLDSMETWAAALSISNAITSDMGFKRALGVETILKDIFDGGNKPNEGLETIAAQFAIFDDLSENDQRAMLASIITNSDNSKESLIKLVNAWLDGDTDALLTETNTGMLTNPIVREALLDGRNRKWVKVLEQKMSQDRDIRYFVAVGAAHLVGENGVPELLRKAGYSVERIQ